VVAWKGLAVGSAALAQARAAIGEIDHDEVIVPDEGLDLVAYRSVAERVGGELICFLNTSSVVLADGWLELLARHLRPGVGAVGATGSWESPLSGARLLRRLLRRGRYLPFPNPHLRTNAFLLRRASVLDLWWPDVSTKGEAWELESGTRSITRQVEEQGLHVLVAGRDGEAFPRERWAASDTFRIGDQRNLVVADNRTRQFAEAPPRFRRKLTRLAWGDPPGSMAPPSLAQDA
jgi:hypothetical protein